MLSLSLADILVVRNDASTTSLIPLFMTLPLLLLLLLLVHLHGTTCVQMALAKSSAGDKDRVD